VELPGLAPKGDVSDWLDAGHSVEELRQLAEDAEPRKAEADSNTDKKRRPSQKAQVIDCVERAGVKLFHDRYREACAAVPGPTSEHVTSSGTSSRMKRRESVRAGAMANKTGNELASRAGVPKPPNGAELCEPVRSHAA
jgi:hypothetical protein